MSNTLSQSDAVAVKNFFEQPAENYGNDSAVEVQWAIKAYQHAEVHFNLLKAVDPALLKLTPVDDEIHKDFRDNFPDVSVNVIDEEAMKSVDGKVQWRKFCEKYRGVVEDYNMGTLLRINASEDVSDNNTTIVPRIQFLAIEVARNRGGHNDALRDKYGSNSSGITQPMAEKREPEEPAFEKKLKSMLS